LQYAYCMFKVGVGVPFYLAKKNIEINQQNLPWNSKISRFCAKRNFVSPQKLGKKFFFVFAFTGNIFSFRLNFEKKMW
jgi:hypothetical protein